MNDDVEKPAKMRLFLACDPPEEVRKNIAAVQAKLQKKYGGGVKWVRPEGIHLTLKFFGSTPVSEIETIRRVVQENVKGQSAMHLRISRIGAFPNARRPRVIWLGIEGDVSRLIALQKKIDAGLEVYGFEKEERAFSPHLTLGRLKTPQALPGLEELTADAASFTTGEFDASALILFRSDLRRDGAVYTKLETMEF